LEFETSPQSMVWGAQFHTGADGNGMGSLESIVRRGECKVGTTNSSIWPNFLSIEMLYCRVREHYAIEFIIRMWNHVGSIECHMMHGICF